MRGGRQGGREREREGRVGQRVMTTPFCKMRTPFSNNAIFDVK